MAKSIFTIWREELWPFCEDGWIEGLRSELQSAQLDWYEEHIFNEERLYKALGKEDARSVLGVWRRFRQLAESVRRVSDGGKEAPDG